MPGPGATANLTACRCPTMLMRGRPSGVKSVITGIRGTLDDTVTHPHRALTALYHWHTSAIHQLEHLAKTSSLSSCQQIRNHKIEFTRSASVTRIATRAGRKKSDSNLDHRHGSLRFRLLCRHLRRLQAAPSAAGTRKSLGISTSSHLHLSTASPTQLSCTLLQLRLNYHHHHYLLITPYQQCHANSPNPKTSTPPPPLLPRLTPQPTSSSPTHKTPVCLPS